MENNLYEHIITTVIIRWLEDDLRFHCYTDKIFLLLRLVSKSIFHAVNKTTIFHAMCCRKCFAIIDNKDYTSSFRYTIVPVLDRPKEIIIHAIIDFSGNIANKIPFEDIVKNIKLYYQFYPDGVIIGAYPDYIVSEDLNNSLLKTSENKFYDLIEKAYKAWNLNTNKPSLTRTTLRSFHHYINTDDKTYIMYVTTLIRALTPVP